MTPARKAGTDTPSDPTEEATQPGLDEAVERSEADDATRGPKQPAADEVPDGALKVDVAANLSLAGQILQVNQTGVVVPDSQEVRDCIAAGYLTLVD